MTSLIKRVLVAPLNYSHRQNGQYGAFEEVFGKDNVYPFDFLRSGNAHTEIIAAAKHFQPDWIWLQIQMTTQITPETIRQLRRNHPAAYVTHWMGDCRDQVPQSLSNICKAASATFLSDVGQIPMYQAAGAERIAYLQIGLDWNEDVIGEPAWEPPFTVPDVVFCGGYYHKNFAKGFFERLSMVHRMMAEAKDRGFSFGVVGTGWPSHVPVVGTCHVKQQHHVYKRAKVALSINHYNDIARYYSDRHLIAMASGTPTVARYVPELELEFDNGEHLLWWNTEDELVRHVADLLGDPDYAAAIGYAGRQHVIDKHTWFHRAKRAKFLVDVWQTEERVTTWR